MDEEAKDLVKQVVEKLPATVDLTLLSEICVVYCGTAHSFKGDGWAIFLDWNVLHKSDEAEDRLAKTRAEMAAKGVIALNLAHYTLRHGPDIIHLPRSLQEAKRLARKWDFKQEVYEMEKAYL